MDGRETVGAWIVPMKVVLLVTLIDSYAHDGDYVGR
jgi:hypothetical protein